jgi:tetratricopeptide (TPR) repeat protein
MGPQWDALWADLLIKLILLHPAEGPALAARYLDKKVTPGSPAQAAIARAMTWAQAPVEEFERHLAGEEPGSRGEALVLECLCDKLEDQPSTEVLRIVGAMRRRHPTRAALRQVYDAFLSRRAAELAGEGKFEDALRLVETCLREQPHDAISHQNRAALFTLMREPGPYHDAWAALNAHQYRLVLLGAVDPATIEQIIKTHRLFSQQARGNTEEPGRPSRGIFRAVEESDGGKPRTVVNVDEIAADPEILRQWTHHTRAELIFRHVALKTAAQGLLEPVDRSEAALRAASLEAQSQSLATLVPQEGAALAQLLSRRWHDAASRLRTRYDVSKPSRPPADAPNGSPAPADALPAGVDSAEDNEVRLLKEEHLAVIADLYMLCLQWRPEGDRLGVAEELLKFADAEMAFLDEQVLRAKVMREGYETPFGLKVLHNHVEAVTGIENGRLLAQEQRKAIIGAFMAELLCEMASAAYAAHSGNAKEAASRAMSYIDRARSLRSADWHIELTAAGILCAGEFYDEARHAIERFRRYVKPENVRAIERADSIEAVLKERRKEARAGYRRERDLDAARVEQDHGHIAELEEELDRNPASWPLYENLAKKLAAAGRFDEAVALADRSVARCLNKVEQLNARTLAIEARGLRALATSAARAAQLYAVGAHDPARNAIEGLRAAGPLDYALSYLLGRCQLAAGLPDQALRSFEAAMQSCERQLHRSVLRHLTENIDNAYLNVARSAVSAELQEGLTEHALQYSCAVFARLQEPAAWLVDFARVLYSIALSRAGIPDRAIAMPRIQATADWRPRLEAAVAQPTDIDRAIALAELAANVHPPTARQAGALASRAETLKRQLVAVEAVNDVGRILSTRDFTAVIATLDALAPAIAAEPRLVRFRVLALLGLNRFDEADSAVEQIGEGGSAEIREFVSQYPGLSFKQRIGCAQRLLKDANPRDAMAALNGAVPIEPKDAVDLAYCRAFALALEGYELRNQGNRQAAHPNFLGALRLIEPHVRSGHDEGMPHLTGLYDRLEKEVDDYGER